MASLFDDLSFPPSTGVDDAGVPVWARQERGQAPPFVEGIAQQRPQRATGPGGRDLLAGLNPPQREAVVHEGSPLLIVAGAGAG